MKSFILKLSILLFALSSCSRELTISKRHYRPGYYVSMQNKQNRELEKEKAQQSKDPLSTFISYVANKSKINKNEKGIGNVSKDTVTEKLNFYREPKDEKKKQEAYEEASVLCYKELMASSPYKLSKEIINESVNKLDDEIPKEKGFKWKEILFWTMLSVGLILLAYGIVTSSLLLVVLGSILFASQFAFLFILKDISEFYYDIASIELLIIILGLCILLLFIGFNTPILLLSIAALILVEILLWKYLGWNEPSFWSIWNWIDLF